jgi:hypothetical protein
MWEHTTHMLFRSPFFNPETIFSVFTGHLSCRNAGVYGVFFLDFLFLMFYEIHGSSFICPYESDVVTCLYALIKASKGLEECG